MPTILRLPVLFCAVLTIVATATVAARKAPAPQDAAGPAGLVTQSVLGQSLDAFIVESANTSLLAYARLSAPKQKLLALFAYEVAKLRRAALKHLIRRDPKDALLLSLTPGQRQGLPKYVLALLETRIHAVGDLTESISEAIPLEDQPPDSRTSWTASINQTTREAFVYGVRLEHQTKYDTPLHGIAIDDVMAVDESPLYLYDDFEILQLGFQPGQIVATSGGLPILLQSLEVVRRLRQDLIDRLLRFGPYALSKLIPPGDPHPWTTGLKRVLVIKADFSDRPGALATDDEITAAFDEASSFYDENSQGRTSLTPTILPSVLRLPSTVATYALRGETTGNNAIRDDAAAAARAYDASVGGAGMYDPDSYDRFVVLTPRVFSYPTGSGDYAGKAIVVTGQTLVFTTLAHEMGHTFGFAHSSFWGVAWDADPIGPGTCYEYGDAWDMMGSAGLDDTAANPRKRHFNAYFKWLAGWLPYPDYVYALPGTFRLYRHDAAGAAGLRAIRIDANAEKWYWLDIRRQFPWNPSMAMGIEVRQVMKSSVSPPCGIVDLLDMEPREGTSVNHSLTPFGSFYGTFRDTVNGIHIRVTGVGTDSIGEYADIVIER